MRARTRAFRKENHLKRTPGHTPPLAHASERTGRNELLPWDFCAHGAKLCAIRLSEARKSGNDIAYAEEGEVLMAFGAENEH